MSYATIFDIALSVPLLLSFYRGFRKGLIIELASLAGLVLGIYGGIKFSGFASEILVQKFDVQSGWLPLISFGIIFILILLAVHLIARLIESIINIASLKLVNKITGAVFCFLKTSLIIFVLLFLLNLADMRMNFMPGTFKQESFYLQALEAVPFDETILEQLSPVIKKE